jgi:transcriptional antiterminator RfaH
MDATVMVDDPLAQAIERERDRLRRLAAKPLMPASFPIGRGWFVAVAQPRRMNWVSRTRCIGPFVSHTVEAFDAEHEIIELGFETFAPAERRYRKARGRKTVSVLPLFANYIFVRFDREKDSWENILSLDAVQDILMVADLPVRIPDGLITTLRRGEEAGAFDYVRTTPAFKIGQSVQVKEGPFTGLIGKIKAAKAHKRVKILLDSLGSVDIDACFLERI